MTRTWLRTLAGAFVALYLLCALPAEAGDIEGQVSITSTVPPRVRGKKRVSYYEDQDEGGLPPGTDVDEREFVVISLEGKELKATPKTVDMVQQNKDFVPHVLVISRGSTVRFVNNDRIYHHIYSVSNPGAFEIRRYLGKSKTKTFDEPNDLEIFCGIHPRMNAYIYVADNDFFCQPKGGKYKLKGVPAGTYTLKAWHPRLKTVTQTVKVPESGAVTVDLKL